MGFARVSSLPLQRKILDNVDIEVMELLRNLFLHVDIRDRSSGSW